MIELYNIMNKYKENFLYYIRHIGYEIPSEDEFLVNGPNYIAFSTGDLTCAICAADISVTKMTSLQTIIQNAKGKKIVAAPESKRDKFPDIDRFIPMHKLVIKYPECTTVPKFYKVSKEELEDNLITPSNLPHIKFDDQMVIWSNSKIGEVIAIEIPHKVTGQSLVYRVVV